MEDKLRELIEKRVDVSFGNTASVRGRVVSVENGVLSLDDAEGNRVLVAVDKIAFFTKVREADHRPGFLTRLD